MAKTVQSLGRWRAGCLAVVFALSQGPHTVLAVDKQPAAVLPRKQVSPAPGKLSLCAKDPATWRVIGEGPRGTLSFDRESGAFTFSARRLHPNSRYALVRHTDGAISGDLLAQGSADKTGELLLNGIWGEWSGKIWLLPGADVAVTGKRVTLLVWHPERILFEEKVLGIPCACND